MVLTLIEYLETLEVKHLVATSAAYHTSQDGIATDIFLPRGKTLVEITFYLLRY
jgi:hypothetical protein